MIFLGATPAEQFVSAAQQTATKLLTDIINSPTASAADKARAQETLAKIEAQAAAAWAAKPKTFIEQNRTALLIGGAAALAAGVGYWAIRRRARPRPRRR